MKTSLTHHIGFVWLVVLVLCGSAFPAWAKLELRGTVKILGDYNELTPVKNTMVHVEETGDSDVTTDLGAFRLFLPDVFRAGEAVSLRVDKEGYQVLHPLAGKVRIPANPLKDPVSLQLDKEGSHRFLSREAFALLIENISEKAKNEVKAGTERQELDLSRYLKEWAVQYGFGIDKVRAELDAWATEIEEKQEDLYELGLAAFYKENFQEAAEKFTQSAKHHEAQLTTVREQEQKLQVQKQELQTKVIRDYRQAGHAYYQNYQFQEALNAYQKALAEIEKEDNPQEWASLMNNIGNTYTSLGERVSGEAAQQCLTEAVAACKAALTVYTRETLPQDWAMTQMNLGNALRNQGERAGGAEGQRLLAEAVAAYRAALTVYTREILPQDWALTQMNLGGALLRQGERAGGAEGQRLLAKAVAAYRAALTVRTRETLPQDWALTQMNLGNALANQGDRAGGAEGQRLLAAAVAAYRAALTVYTRETLPQQWAATQINLGNALTNQGIRAGDAEGQRLLAEAVAAYRAALTVCTREHLPQDWARTQMNLGNALQSQGDRAGGAEGQRLLAEAVAAYRAALAVYTRETLPQQWAATQINLGVALREQALMAEHEEQASLLQESVAALNLAQEVFTYEHFPAYWAKPQRNLANTYVALKDLPHAIECYVMLLVLTGRFTEAEEWFSCQLPALDSASSLLPPLHAMEMVNLLAQGKAAAVPSSLDALIHALQQQPEDYTVDWDFKDINYFITTSEALASHREWLLSLFAALEEPNRDAILHLLHPLCDSFTP